MRKAQLGMGAIALLGLSLAACGGTEVAENNVATDDVNAMMNLEELPPAEPAANAAVEPPAASEPQSEPAAKPATPKPAPAKPAPAKPKAPETAPEANTSDPTCLPEHRAAGHC